MWPRRNWPPVRGFGFCQQLDQRGFACAVHAHQGNAVAAFDHETDIAKYFFLAVRFGHVNELGDDPAAGFRLLEGKVDYLLFFRQFDAVDLFQFLDAALHLLGFGRLIAETIDENLQLLDALALIAIRRIELLHALRL